MKKKIRLTIQEIVNDYYSLAEEEGYLSGLAEVGCCEESDKESYHNKMKELIDKYLPSWRNKIDDKYWEKDTSEDEKGIILSTILCKNFKEIFYQLV